MGNTDWYDNALAQTQKERACAICSCRFTPAQGERFCSLACKLENQERVEHYKAAAIRANELGCAIRDILPLESFPV